MGHLAPLAGAATATRYSASAFGMLTIPLRWLKAEELALEVKKMLGKYRNAVALKKANQLVLSDSAGNLRRIYRMLQQLDKQKAR